MVGAVEAAEIGDQTRLNVRVLGAEADRESAREGTILLDHVPVGGVYVLRGNRARFRDIAHNVSIVVVARDEERPVDADRDETAHAARALLRAGEVVVPEAFDRPCRAVRERDPLEDDVAAIVCEGVRLARLPLVAVETFDALHGSAHRRHRTVADGAVDVNRSVANATRAARNIKSGSSMNWNHCS